MPREPTKTKLINNKVCLSTAAICEVLEVTQQTLSLWDGKGCPKAGRGWWAIGDVLRWRGMVGEGNDNADEKVSWAQKKLESEVKLKQEKASEAEFKNQIVKGEYVKKDEITAELQRFFVVLKRSMQGYSRTVATELSGFVDVLVARRIEKKISESTNNVLEQLSIDGIYEPSKPSKKKKA
jgi:hypothetical protein